MADPNAGLLESWELSLHAKRPRTLDLYLREIRRFADWLEVSGRSGDLLDVTKRDVEEWIARQRSEGRAANTVRNRWVVLRAFYGWATQEGEVAENPVARVHVAKPHPPAPRVVPEADLAALMKVCTGTDFKSRRDLAIVRTLLATGLRVSELVALQEADLDLRSRVAAVRDGKGGRARIVKFDPSTAAALDRYKRVRSRHRCAADKALWIGHRGAMTRRGVPQMLAARSVEAGIAHVHPHQLRHTFADRWLAGGGNEGDLLRLGGWENSDIMRRYGESRAVDRALDAYDQIDPMRRL